MPNALVNQCPFSNYIFLQIFFPFFHLAALKSMKPSSSRWSSCLNLNSTVFPVIDTLSTCLSTASKDLIARAAIWVALVFAAVVIFIAVGLFGILLFGVTQVF